MSLDMWEERGHALTELRDDPDVRVVVPVGAGNQAFVSGADISQFEQTRHNAQASEEYSRRGVARPLMTSARSGHTKRRSIAAALSSARAARRATPLGDPDFGRVMARKSISLSLTDRVKHGLSVWPSALSSPH